MIMHKVDTQVGSALRNGRTFYAYKAVCGSPIVAAGPLNKGAIVATGAEPHVHCAKCFKNMEETQDVVLPAFRGEMLQGAEFDEMGRPLGSPVEVADTAQPLGDTNAPLKTENYPYGAPIRRR